MEVPALKSADTDGSFGWQKLVLVVAGVRRVPKAQPGTRVKLEGLDGHSVQSQTKSKLKSRCLETMGMKELVGSVLPFLKMRDQKEWRS